MCVGPVILIGTKIFTKRCTIRHRKQQTPNALWGSDAELHPPRRVGAKFNYLVDTEEGGGVEANPSGYSLEIKEKFTSSLIQEII